MNGHRTINKICMVIPYFGKWPEWFPLYLHSCSKVQKIDFFFFTDCGIPKTIYTNTKFVEISYEKYCEHVSAILNIEFKPSNPYKLVDLKPFLHLIHNDIVEKYDFWGFSDIDLVYGNINSLVNEVSLLKYDIITTHSDRLAGHFTVIRTNSVYSLAYHKIPDWKEKLSSPTNYGLDEKWMTLAVAPLQKWISRVIIHVFRCKPRTKKFYKTYQMMRALTCFSTPRALFKECFTTIIPSETQHWIYDAQRNTIEEAGSSQEIPYLHFLFFKKTPYLETKSYWKNGFWQIPASHEITDTDRIDISLNGIILMCTE